MTRLLAFAGSSRKASFNRQLLDLLVAMAQEAGADITTVDLAELDIPIYNGDLEAASGLPTGAEQFRSLLHDHQGLLIASPEYNGFVTPLLLNSIDWATRDGSGGADLTPFRGKTAAIVSASPGQFGGLRSAGHLRTLLSGTGCHVLPMSLPVGSAGRAFDESGKLKEERYQQRAEQLVSQLIALTEKLA